MHSQSQERLRPAGQCWDLASDRQTEVVECVEEQRTVSSEARVDDYEGHTQA